MAKPDSIQNWSISGEGCLIIQTEHEIVLVADLERLQHKLARFYEPRTQSLDPEFVDLARRIGYTEIEAHETLQALAAGDEGDAPREIDDTLGVAHG